MPNPRWTYNVPGPIREEIPGRDLNSGHPTAPGPNDPSLIAVKQADGTYNYVSARGRMAVREGAKNIGNGVPSGNPRLKPAPKNTNPIPGEFGRPIQPGTNYNNGSDVSGP